MKYRAKSKRRPTGKAGIKPRSDRNWGPQRRARSKVDWAGSSPGDAFRAGMNYHHQLNGRRILFDGCTRAIHAVVRYAGISTSDGGYKPQTKPQLGPLYTSYPAPLAAHAAQGLTAFLEYGKVAEGSVLRDILGPYLENPAVIDRVAIDPAVYKKLVHRTADIVQTRLLLHDLSGSPGLGSIEIYRLFACSQKTLSFSALPEIIEAVVLYGDVLPLIGDLELHPTTRMILTELEAVSSPYQFSLQQAEEGTHVWVGAEWVRALARKVARLIPPPDSPSRPPVGRHGPRHAPGSQGSGMALFDWASHSRSLSDTLPPLGGPHPPSVFEPPTAADRAMEALGVATTPPNAQASKTPKGPESELSKTLNDLRNNISKATGNAGNWEDPRSDQVEREMREKSFQKGTIEGTPTDGHVVDVKWNGQNIAKGDLFDCPLALSDDLETVDKLIDEADPLVKALRRLLYLNTTYPLHVDRFRTSGALDPTRLAMAEFSGAVFRQYEQREERDPRGNPVVLVACDGSGSLTANQMRMAKLLVTAWLLSTAKSGVQLLAGLYHSGVVRSSLSGPLVQWIYHPHKSASLGNLDAVRGVASLPESGTGCQSDALSVAYMLEEARTIARGKMVYLILITDTAWNRCDPQSGGGEEEMVNLFVAANQEFGTRLHTTLVALGVSKPCALERLVDQTVNVSTEQLTNPQAVASDIGTMVASCMRERRKSIGR